MQRQEEEKKEQLKKNLYWFYHPSDQNSFYLEKLSLEVRCAYNMYVNKTPCDAIIEKKLYLTKLPTVKSKILGTSNQHIDIQNYIRKQTQNPNQRIMIVRAIEDKEAGIYAVTLADWHDIGIEDIISLSMPDHTADASSEDAIINVILRIKKFIDDGGSVVVHCMAGMGRSATIVAILLGVFFLQDKNIEEIHGHLKQKRSVVQMNVNQKAKAAKIIEMMRERFSAVDKTGDKQNSFADKQRDLAKELKILLGSWELKDEMSRLNSLGLLREYRNKNQGLRTIVDDLLKSIYIEENENWYVNLPQFNKVFGETPSYTYYFYPDLEEQKKRQKICADFVGELNKKLAEMLHCSIDEITSIKQNIELKSKRASKGLQ